MCNAETNNDDDDEQVGEDGNDMTAHCFKCCLHQQRFCRHNFPLNAGIFAGAKMTGHGKTTPGHLPLICYHFNCWSTFAAVVSSVVGQNKITSPATRCVLFSGIHANQCFKWIIIVNYERSHHRQDDGLSCAGPANVLVVSSWRRSTFS